jgi:hypothetical protein
MREGEGLPQLLCLLHLANAHRAEIVERRRLFRRTNMKLLS